VPSHLRLPPRPAGEAPPLSNQGLIRVAYSDPATGVFVGSPAITRLDAGTLLVSHVRRALAATAGAAACTQGCLTIYCLLKWTTCTSKPA
jgi:hypothetical protein